MRFLVAAGLAALCSCGSSGEGAEASVTMAWRFADGRRCAEAGVLRVKASAKNGSPLGCQPTDCNFLCSDGESQGVQLLLPAQAGALDFAATSPQGDVLYRGTRDFGGPPLPAATVVLYFTGGK